MPPPPPLPPPAPISAPASSSAEAEQDGLGPGRWRQGVNGGRQRYGDSGGVNKEYWRGFFQAKNLGKEAVGHNIFLAKTLFAQIKVFAFRFISCENAGLCHGAGSR